MAVTKIQTFGPREVNEGRIRRYGYYAEAVGADGRLYYASGRSRPTPFVEEQEHWRQQAARILEGRMRDEGLWEETP